MKILFAARVDTARTQIILIMMWSGSGNRLRRLTVMIAIERLVSINAHYVDLSLARESEEDSVLNPTFKSRRPHQNLSPTITDFIR